MEIVKKFSLMTFQLFSIGKNEHIGFSLLYFNCWYTVCFSYIRPSRNFRHACPLKKILAKHGLLL
jgi:hypothetical protein